MLKKAAKNARAKKFSKPAVKKEQAASKGAKAPKTTKTSTPRAESKGTKIIELHGKAKGASLTPPAGRRTAVRGNLSMVAVDEERWAYSPS